MSHRSVRSLPARGKRRCAIAAALLLTVAAAAAQIIAPALSSRHYDFDISWLNGTPVHGEARGVDGLDFQPGVTVTLAGERATMHRLFLDRTHHLYFGYDLLAVPEPGTARVHVTLSKLTNVQGFQGMSIEGFSPGGRAVPSKEQVLPYGEPLTIPLEVDARGATVLQDKLTFGFRLH